MNNEASLSISELLQTIINGNIPEYLTLGELKDILHERGFGLLMVIFSLPIAIPLPYPPGFTTVAGVPLMLFSLQMVLGFDSPWLPKYLGKIGLKRITLCTIVNKTTPYLQRIEHYLKPRIPSISTRTGERVIGLISFLCAISIALPIIFGNAIPALGILLMAIGLLNRDGVVILGGMVVSVIGLIIASAVVLIGIDGIQKLINLVL